MQTHVQVRRPHVYAIHESPEFHAIVRELLEEEGYAVTTASDMPDAFDQIAAWHPDVVLVDLVPGDQERWQLLEQLHANPTTCPIPVLLLSTSEELIAQAQEQAARYGGSASLTMPFDLEDLLQRIEALIAQP